MNNGEPFVILLVDDDDDDCFLIEEAFKESKMDYKLQIVNDAENLLEYLYQKGKYGNSQKYPRPNIVLLDLNMPRKDGREALEEIKMNNALRHIPIVVLSTSDSPKDVLDVYKLGANSFICKPVSFENLIGTIEIFGRYWLKTVQLPDVKN